MKVRELIEALKFMPQNAGIVFEAKFTEPSVTWGYPVQSIHEQDPKTVVLGFGYEDKKLRKKCAVCDGIDNEHAPYCAYHRFNS